MTPHIEAKKEDIANIVIMPGDPLRAKHIAETYLDDYQLINQVRGMLGYTGTYKGRKVTVMGSGMGMPSMGIYSYELFNFYDVDIIIRIGSCGAYTDTLNLYDLVIVDECYSDSNYAYNQNLSEDKTINGNLEINNIFEAIILNKQSKYKRGCIFSSDVFYSDINDINNLYNEHNCLGVEMESFALFHNANVLNKKAACLLTVSDNLITKEVTTASERQLSFNEMVEVALEATLKL